MFRFNRVITAVAALGLSMSMVACEKKEEAKPAEASAGSADLGSLAAMLKGRWKEGKGGDPAPKVATIKPGTIRTCKIVSLDAEHKKITVELLG